jgi:hypothetical protein
MTYEKFNDACFLAFGVVSCVAIVLFVVVCIMHAQGA